MQLGVTGLKRVKDSSKKLLMYSKQWNAGDTMRIIFPVCYDDGKWEIIGGGVWGHKVNDFEGIGLKTAFIPSLTEFDENGEPIGRPDITWQFSQIASVFVAGQRAADTAAIMGKDYPSESARTEALRKIDYKYDQKNNMKAVKPAIARASFYITTEVICLKMTNGVPNLDSATLVSFPLASTRIDQLYTILRDPRYAPNQGEEYWEIEWKYPANPDKSASGRAANPAGLTAEYRIATQFPDEWKRLDTYLNQIAFDSETIVKRATKSVPEDRIRSALTDYSFSNSQFIDTAPEDDYETLCKNASVIKELGFMRTLHNTTIISKLKESLDNIVTPQPELVPDLAAAAPVTETPIQPAAPIEPVVPLNPNAPNLADLINNNAPATMGTMRNDVNLADMDESELEML